MRSTLLVVPAALTLIAGAGLRPTPGLPSPVLRPEMTLPDTGESLRRLRTAPTTACPMPVDRPDPASTVPMPTARTPSALSTTLVVDSSSPAAGSRMPVVRSGCRNPLDRPNGEHESVWIEEGPQRRR